MNTFSAFFNTQSKISLKVFSFAFVLVLIATMGTTVAYAQSAPLTVSGSCIDDDLRISKNGRVVRDNGGTSGCADRTYTLNATCDDIIRVEVRDVVVGSVGFDEIRLSYQGQDHVAPGWRINSIPVEDYFVIIDDRLDALVPCDAGDTGGTDTSDDEESETTQDPASVNVTVPSGAVRVGQEVDVRWNIGNDPTFCQITGDWPDSFSPGLSNGSRTVSFSAVGEKTVGIYCNKDGVRSSDSETIQVEEDPPISVDSCTISPVDSDELLPGGTARFSAEGVSGGSGQYSYAWNYDISAIPAIEELVTSSDVESTPYNSSGQYTARVTVGEAGDTFFAGDTDSATCSITVEKLAPLVIVVNGVGGGDEFSEAVREILKDVEAPYEIKDVFATGDLKSAIDDAISDAGEDRDILIAGWGIGAVVAYNNRSEWNSDIDYLYYDPPYDIPFTDAVSGFFASIIQNENPGAIKKARDNNIASQPQTIDWTDGYDWQPNREIDQQCHGNFKPDRYGLGALVDIREWVETGSYGDVFEAPCGLDVGQCVVEPNPIGLDQDYRLTVENVRGGSGNYKYTWDSHPWVRYSSKVSRDNINFLDATSPSQAGIINIQVEVEDNNTSEKVVRMCSFETTAEPSAVIEVTHARHGNDGEAIPLSAVNGEKEDVQYRVEWSSQNVASCFVVGDTFTGTEKEGEYWTSHTQTFVIECEPEDAVNYDTVSDTVDVVVPFHVNFVDSDRLDLLSDGNLRVLFGTPVSFRWTTFPQNEAEECVAEGGTDNWNGEVEPSRFGSEAFFVSDRLYSDTDFTIRCTSITGQESSDTLSVKVETEAKALAILYNYTNDDRTPFTVEEAKLSFDELDDYYSDVSYGKEAAFKTEVVGWWQLPKESSGSSPGNPDKTDCDFDNDARLALDLAEENGVDLSEFTFFYFVNPRSESCVREQEGWGIPEADFNGKVFGIGSNFTWLNGIIEPKTIIHETGHMIGLFHNEGTTCQKYGPAFFSVMCDTRLGADTSSIMGYGRFEHGLPAIQKQFKGWLSDKSVQAVTRSGNYKIKSSSENPEGIKILRLDNVVDSEFPMYFDYRTAVGEDSDLEPRFTKGAGIYLKIIGGGNFISRLDATYRPDAEYKLNSVENIMAIESMEDGQEIEFPSGDGSDSVIVKVKQISHNNEEVTLQFIFGDEEVAVTQPNSETRTSASARLGVEWASLDAGESARGETSENYAKNTWYNKILKKVTDLTFAQSGGGTVTINIINSDDGTTQVVDSGLVNDGSQEVSVPGDLIAGQYYLEIIDEQTGNTIGSSAPFTVDTLRESFTAVTSSELGGVVELSWSEDGVADGIEIYRGSTTTAPIATLASSVTEYTDREAEPNTAYDYYIRTYGTDTYSSFSTARTVASGEAPITDEVAEEGVSSTGPLSVNASPVGQCGGGINIEWEEQGDINEGYLIYRDGTSASDKIATIMDVSQTSYTDTEVIPGTRHEYHVTAFRDNVATSEDRWLCDAGQASQVILEDGSYKWECNVTYNGEYTTSCEVPLDVGDIDVVGSVESRDSRLQNIATVAGSVFNKVKSVVKVEIPNSLQALLYSFDPAGPTSCGSADGKVRSNLNQFSYGLCEEGTRTGFGYDSTENKWNWSCKDTSTYFGRLESGASCSAYDDRYYSDAECGWYTSANSGLGVATSEEITEDRSGWTCNNGEFQGLNNSTRNRLNWTCGGEGFAPAECSVRRAPECGIKARTPARQIVSFETSSATAPQVCQTTPVVDVTVSDASDIEVDNELFILANDTLSVSWTTQNEPDSCEAFGGWSGVKDTSGGTESGSVGAGSYEVGLTCTNSAGSATDSVTINAMASPSLQAGPGQSCGGVSVDVVPNGDAQRYELFRGGELVHSFNDVDPDMPEYVASSTPGERVQFSVRAYVDGMEPFVASSSARANISSCPVNGVCGEASGSDASTMPTVNQCAVGTFEAISSFGLDVDGDGQAKPLTDGMLIVRYMFGFNGDALTDGAVSDNATRENPTTYLQHLVSSGALDVDGNGQMSALSDGILIVRYLFGFKGSALVSGAIGSGATRTSPEVITQYLDDINSTYTWECKGDNSGTDAFCRAEQTLNPQNFSAVTASQCGGRVDLDWSPVENATGYELYRGGVQSDNLIATFEPGETSYMDTNLLRDASYEYRVRSVVEQVTSDYTYDTAVSSEACLPIVDGEEVAPVVPCRCSSVSPVMDIGQSRLFYKKARILQGDDACQITVEKTCTETSNGVCELSPVGDLVGTGINPDDYQFSYCAVVPIIN